MTDAFDKCLPVILKAEGGYVNHPADPGGMTNLGVTKRVWDEWTGRKSTEADMRALTVAKVAPLYRVKYWNALSCDAFPAPLALCVFDFGVNAGVGRAARYLQRMVGAAEDGHIGPGTLKAVQQFVTAKGIAGAVKAYQDARRGYYRKLGTFGTFGRGWLARVEHVETVAEGWV